MKKFRVWQKQLIGEDFDSSEEAQDFCRANYIPENEESQIIIEGFEEDEDV